MHGFEAINYKIEGGEMVKPPWKEQELKFVIRMRRLR